MVPPGMDIGPAIKQTMELNGYTKCVELAPKGDCKRFRLS